MTIKILIADDHKIIRDGMTGIIDRKEGWEVDGYAPDGERVIALLESRPVDIVLMDISMPVMDGIETTRYLREHFPEVKVIILSMHNEARYIRKALEAGARGYLLKTAGKAQVIEAIETVASGGEYYPMEVKDILFTSFQPDSPETLSPENLTQREREVLKLIASEFNTREIADALCISTHTVDTHRKNLLSKLNAKNVAGLTRFAIQHGLVDI